MRKKKTLCSRQQMAKAYCSDVALSLTASRHSIHETMSRDSNSTAAHRLYLVTDWPASIDLLAHVSRRAQITVAKLHCKTHKTVVV